VADVPTTSTSGGGRAASSTLVAAVTAWGARLAWLAVAVVGGRAVGDALADHDAGAARALTAGAWIGWAVGAIALAVASVATLTTARVVVPGALAVTVAGAIGGADAGALAALGAPALVATVLVLAAEVGRAWVQASAYGDEQRFPLRPPLGYLVASVVTWAVWVAAVLVGAVALVSANWLPGGVAAAVVVVGALVLPRRWHQLSRRWLVAVPAGLVVHDPVVLGETLMVPAANVTGVRLVKVGPDRPMVAADLTGPTAAVGVEVTLAEAATALFPPRPGLPKGRAVHVLAFIVAPSRPGAVLAAARRRRLPVP
jgi:hypothetical protein